MSLELEVTEPGATPNARALPVGKARPLSPLTYLTRNLGKSLPLVGVIVLAVLLISGIISLINSIPLSIRTIYSYSKQMVAVTPRGDQDMVPGLVRRLTTGAPVPIERIMLARGTGTQVQSIVGKWQFFVMGLKPEDAKYLLRRFRTRSLEGRMARVGMPEVVVSSPVATNKGFKIGTVVLGPNISESYSPKPVKVVGIARSDEWFMLGDYEYQRANHYPDVDVIMAFAPTLAQQEKLDRWAYRTLKGARAQVLAYFRLEQQTATMFNTLFVILDVVIGMLVLVITLMMGMLINIYQSQRLVEFGLLQAMGYTKRQLMARVLAETLLVLAAGWALGLAAGYGMLELTKAQLMEPRAFAISTWDPMAIRYTIPVPITILIVASLTIYIRFRNFDPVAIVERRLV